MNIGQISRRGRQYAPPLLIDRLDDSGTARLLNPLGFDRGELQHDESWLQKLIFRFPQLLPVHEIEPGFSRIVPVCLELPTPAGNVDSLYITENGDLVVAECKLWRNPEGRREMVAQVIDYAHGMSSWTYTDLQDAVRKSYSLNRDTPPRTLYQLIEEAGDIDEAAFVDAVSRNLRLGRMLLLIVGDGIREGVESLSGYLQLHAGFHFTLGIVEMPVFQLPHGGGSSSRVCWPARSTSSAASSKSRTDTRRSCSPCRSGARMPRGDVRQSRKTACSRFWRKSNPGCRLPSNPSSTVLVTWGCSGSGFEVVTISLARSGGPGFRPGRDQRTGRTADQQH